jgi:hypothetical protein
MNFLMVKRDKNVFPNLDTMMKGGVMSKRDYYCH